MDKQIMEPVIKFIAACGILIGMIVYLNKLKKTTTRQKIFLFGNVTLLLPFLLISVAYFTKTFRNEYAGAFFAFMSVCLIIFGLVHIKYANDAVRLYSDRRNKTGASRFVISTLPKRESFVIKGSIVLIVGLIFFYFTLKLWRLVP